MENKNDALEDITRDIQAECHKFVEYMVDELQKTKKHKNNKIENQDLVNIFFYKKLADIELRLRTLERKTHINYN